eukprot:6980239-Alexandrium_andersonii.AAC.1
MSADAFHQAPQSPGEDVHGGDRRRRLLLSGPRLRRGVHAHRLGKVRGVARAQSCRRSRPRALRLAIY